MKALLTSPEYDSITHYLRAWSLRLKKEHRGQSRFIHLDRKDANRKNFENLLKKRSIDIVIINGHGGVDRMAGNDGEIILDENNNNLLEGTKVHSLSCKTAKQLGPKTVAKGAEAYIGYDEDFVLVYDESKISKPEKDKTAGLFLDAAFTAPKALLNGKTIVESVELTRKKYDKSILEAFNSDVQSEDDQFIKYLIWDRNHLKYFEK